MRHLNFIDGFYLNIFKLQSLYSLRLSLNFTVNRRRVKVETFQERLVRRELVVIIFQTE